MEGRVAAGAADEVDGRAVFHDAIMRTGASVIPVDSEHNAVFQVLGDGNASEVERVTLHVLNQNGAHASLPLPEFIRAAGQPPDVIIPYDREIGLAANLGVARYIADDATRRFGLG